MFNFKNYRVQFDIWGLVLFTIIMIPTIIWLVFPIENDILRKESLTPVIDIIASIFQVIMVAALSLAKNNVCQKPNKHIWIISLIVIVGIYFLGWCLYYCHIVNIVVILILCVVPCVAFSEFAFIKKNGFAFVSAILFMICHIINSSVNFIC